MSAKGSDETEMVLMLPYGSSSSWTRLVGWARVCSVERVPLDQMYFTESPLGLGKQLLTSQHHGQVWSVYDYALMGGG